MTKLNDLIDCETAYAQAVIDKHISCGRANYSHRRINDDGTVDRLPESKLARKLNKRSHKVMWKLGNL